MKNIILLTALFFLNTINAQQFVLTIDNYKCLNDQSKDFAVYNFPKNSQKQLFDKTKEFIQSTFKNLKGDGYNEVEYSQIKLISRTKGTVHKAFGSEFIGSYLTVNYLINIKDEKIMIKPIFTEFEITDDVRSKIYLTGGNSYSGKSIYNKKGNIWLEKHYENANINVNNFIESLIEYLNKDNEW